jgi:hypothetical protein
MVVAPWDSWSLRDPTFNRAAAIKFLGFGFGNFLLSNRSDVISLLRQCLRHGGSLSQLSSGTLILMAANPDLSLKISPTAI